MIFKYFAQNTISKNILRNQTAVFCSAFHRMHNSANHLCLWGCFLLSLNEVPATVQPSPRGLYNTLCNSRQIPPKTASRTLRSTPFMHLGKDTPRNRVRKGYNHRTLCLAWTWNETLTMSLTFFGPISLLKTLLSFLITCLCLLVCVQAPIKTRSCWLCCKRRHRRP